MAVRVEPVTDLGAVWPVLTTFLEELHAYHQPWWPRDLLPDWRQRWLRYVQPGDDRLVLIARGDDSPVGFLNGSIVRDPGRFAETFAHIDDAYVRASARRGGTGAALLQRFEDWARSRGVHEVRLNVVAENAIGLGFWQKRGFSPLSIMMVKRLESRP